METQRSMGRNSKWLRLVSERLKGDNCLETGMEVKGEYNEAM